jgi:hypothetical protein
LVEDLTFGKSISVIEEGRLVVQDLDDEIMFEERSLDNTYPFVKKGRLIVEVTRIMNTDMRIMISYRDDVDFGGEYHMLMSWSWSWSQEFQLTLLS